MSEPQDSESTPPSMMFRSYVFQPGQMKHGPGSVLVVRGPLVPSGSKTWPASFEPVGRIARGDVNTESGFVLECLEGSWYARTFLDLARSEYPNVMWRVHTDVHGLPHTEFGGVAYGIHEGEVVAILAPHAPPHTCWCAQCLLNGKPFPLRADGRCSNPACVLYAQGYVERPADLGPPARS